MKTSYSFDVSFLYIFENYILFCKCSCIVSNDKKFLEIKTCHSWLLRKNGNAIWYRVFKERQWSYANYRDARELSSLCLQFYSLPLYACHFRIAGASLPQGHITHVFLDECGHAMEPEAMSALAGIVEKDAQVVLTGDPHQLGPVIRNTQCFTGDDSLFHRNGLGMGDICGVG